jgi:glutaredoxin
MSQDDVTQIRVGNSPVGIMGLKTAMETMAKKYADKQDDEAEAELLKRLSKKNYIPNRAKENYAKAFLCEFKKFLGKPYEEEVSGDVEIKVLGQGCVQCDKLERDLMEVMAEIDLPADLEHVREIKEIGKYGVMGMPALIINGKVMSVGTVPPKTKLKEWLGELA